MAHGVYEFCSKFHDISSSERLSLGQVTALLARGGKQLLLGSVHTARVHGPWTRMSLWTPLFTAVLLSSIPWSWS